MGALLGYSIEAALIMAVLFIGYKLFMSGTTFHRLNRFSLIAIIVVSWILPSTTSIFEPSVEIAVEADLPMMIGFQNHATHEDYLHKMLWMIPVMIYTVGIIATMAITILSAVKLRRIIRGGDKEKKDGYTLVVTRQAPGPFSWGKYIVLNPADMDSDLSMVISHERTHLRSFHWLDLLLAQTSLIFQWFNPAAWLIINDIKRVHEFKADEVAGEPDNRKYQMMLLKKTVGTSFPTFTDSLNHSQLKLRITMMKKKKSCGFRRVAVMALPAMAAVGMMAITRPSVEEVINDIRFADTGSLFESKVNESFTALQNDYSEPEVNDQSNTVDDEESLPLTTNASLFTPETKEEKADAEKTVEGITYFVDGQRFTGKLEELSPERIKSMTIVKDDPQYPNGKIMIELKEGSEQNVAVAVERLAEFKGGTDALLAFIRDNIKYPEGAKLEKPVRVIVQFTIDAEGNVSDATVKKGAGEKFDAEALRVVNLTNGKWSPASNDGKNIASKYVLPISFKPY